MKNELIALHNELCKVETKGESTVVMANCLQYLAQLVQKAEKAEQADVPKGAMPKPDKNKEEQK